MVPVASLLNPLPPSLERLREPCKFPPPQHTEKIPSSPLSARKHKMSKAAATFVKAKPKGEINYRPYEEQDDTIAAAYDKFEVKPIGQICDYPKRIPYNSEKKTFQRKTGRDGFEVYQYTFRMPGDDRGKDPHAVMWDYNVGLVRITSFFKCLGHSKTMPAKVMTANPGLRDVSHSITGGSISAQGYWVPFEAAKAVAARFCYEIRFVLVPVFGPDFVSMCELPDQGAFMHLSINRGIIQRCQDVATASQSQSRESSMPVSPRTLGALATSPAWPPKTLLRTAPHKAMDFESGYGTDSERSAYPASPISEWTPVNSPRFRKSPPRNVTSTPREEHPCRITGSSKKSRNKRMIFEDDGRPDDEDVLSEQNSMGTPAPSASSKRIKLSEQITPELRRRYGSADIDAACAMVELSMEDAQVGESRRRASA